MQPCATPPQASQAVFHSADRVFLIAACLDVTSLFTASSLCRASHSHFDNDAVWRGRLVAAQRIVLRCTSPSANRLTAASRLLCHRFCHCFRFLL